MKRSILIVEPNKLFAQNIKKVTEAMGYKTTIAGTAQQAVSRADEARPDLVIMEVQLPVHNGIEFLYEFRSYSDWNDIPVIIYSNVLSQHFVNMQGVKKLLGINQYLEKSKVSISQLTDYINETIKT